MNIRDYFCKYGFEDGDNARLLRKADKLRGFILKLINAEFEAHDLPYRAIPVDVSTGHNPIRAIIRWKEDGKDWEWDTSGVLREAPPGSRFSMEWVRGDHPIWKWVDIVVSAVETRRLAERRKNSVNLGAEDPSRWHRTVGVVHLRTNAGHPPAFFH